MEKVGRLSGAEVLSLMEGEVKKLVCVDVRSVEEFKLGTLPGAVNIPSEGAFDEFGNLSVGSDILDVAMKKGQIIVVMGSSKDNDWQIFAEKLVSCQYRRVATLHGGAEVFYGAGVLVVPHA